MFIYKNFSFRGLMAFAGHHLIWLTVWASSATALYYFSGWSWMGLPWLPLSLIGIAVAFYVGFKNNQSYDRLWEARKIWGSIVNSSRSWGIGIRAFVSNQFTEENMSEDDVNAIKKKLILRHIAWLYTLRNQLLIPTTWEHISLGGMMTKITKRRMKTFGVGLMEDQFTVEALDKCLPTEEYNKLINAQNTATQIIDKQAQELQDLRKKNLIDDFRHMELQKILTEFFDHQGKSERIKKFPFPRQYGAMSNIFIGIFIFLLPFGMLSEFSKVGEIGIWLAIPFTVLIAWVFLLMELVGDYSENPFEGLGNDVPMLSLCRMIEIDLREMMGETDLPKPIEPKKGVLM